MKRTKTLLLSLAAAAFSFSTPVTSFALEGGATVDLASAYIFRGAELHDEFSLQPGFELGLPLGEGFGDLTLGTWMEIPLGTVDGYNETDDGDGVIAEIDIYLGYGFDIGGQAFDLTYTEYTFPVAGGGPDREVSVGTETSIGDVGVGLMVAYGFDGVLEDGLYVEATTGYTGPVSPDFGLDLGLTLGAELGDNFDDNGLSHLTISTGTSVGPFAVGLNYIVETDEDVQAIDTDFYGTIGYEF